MKKLEKIVTKIENKIHKHLDFTFCQDNNSKLKQKDIKKFRVKLLFTADFKKSRKPR